jgi:transposase InsO family protein
MEVATPTGARYYVFKDDYSGWCEVQLIQRKTEEPAASKKFTSKLNAQTGEEAKTLRSDGGGEFCSNDFRDWLADSGITHLITPPYTPQLNGVSERANRTIVESARSQMYEKNVPLELWGLAVQCAIYVQNRSISSTNNSTPYQLWYGREPDVSHL